MLKDFIFFDRVKVSKESDLFKKSNYKEYILKNKNIQLIKRGFSFLKEELLKNKWRKVEGCGKVI